MKRKKRRIKTEPLPLSIAIIFLVIGLVLGTVFVFGGQYWNEEVNREDCVRVESLFLSYKERRGINLPRLRGNHTGEISIDCSNGERYFVDEMSVNTELREKLLKLSPGDTVALLIHPNSSTILEFTTEKDTLLVFEDTVALLGGEATGFLFLGAFMYLCALVGVYYTIRGCIDLK